MADIHIGDAVRILNIIDPLSQHWIGRIGVIDSIGDVDDTLPYTVSFEDIDPEHAPRDSFNCMEFEVIGRAGSITALEAELANLLERVDRIRKQISEYQKLET